MSDVQDQNQPQTPEQMQARIEYLNACVQVLENQLHETTAKLTQAQVSATVFRSKMNILGARVSELQEQLAAARAAVPPTSSEPVVPVASAAPVEEAAAKPEASDETAALEPWTASTGVPA